MKIAKNIILLLIIALVLALPAYSLTIKIGSIAPARSPWDKALRELGREWTKITEGKIKIKSQSVSYNKTMAAALDNSII